MRPKVTIAIPNYNYGRYLGTAIESALAQSYPDFELLISDNASMDDSLEVIGRYQDKRIRVFRQIANRGLYFNWNLCLREARGEYFKLLQADDLLTATCLETAVAAMDEAQADLCLMSYGRMDESGKDLPEQAVVAEHEGQLSREDVLRSVRRLTQFVPSSGNMLRTAAAQATGYGTEENFSGDLILWASLVATGRICSVISVLARERVHRMQARRHGRPLEVLKDQFFAIDQMRQVTMDPEARAELHAWEEDVALSGVSASLRLFARGKMHQGIRVIRALAERRNALALVQGGAWRVRSRLRRANHRSPGRANAGTRMEGGASE